MGTLDINKQIKRHWEKYTIKEVGFINNTRFHPSRQKFVDYVILNHINSIVEIGAGELIEYSSIKEQNPDIKYGVIDISDVFLDYCRREHPTIDVFQCPIEKYSSDRQFDLVYAMSVIEHLGDVESAICNMSHISREFYYVLFKWKNSEEELVPNLSKRQCRECKKDKLKIKKYKETREKTKRVIKKCSKEIIRYKNEITKYISKITHASETVQYKSKIVQYKNKITQCENKIAKYRNEVTQYKDEIMK
ncbi:hypothetical protein LCGC14_1756370 [marine sediment metagenome]|uniref:Methyltransferase type 12 domain-containing protein n=1 Tax=marine sediment metagenome TaxID=412755 RepID=A0A0F9H2E4_9ZZZZ